MRKVAAAIGVPLTTYREWEEHGRAIRAENFLKIATYFGISMEELAGQMDGNKISVEERINRILTEITILKAQLSADKKDNN